MEKYAWRAILKPGMKNEYKRRHDEIWPEMVEVLKKAGIKNYTIWLADDELFGYYECEFGIEYAAKVQNESSTVKKWDEYMKDVMTMPKDEKTGAQPLMENVFSME
jgi:L-rhamnose mutarotase